MLLIINAKIWPKENLQGILIENGLIKEIANSDVLLKKYKDINIYDANKKRIIPGLNDSHLHLVGYARLKRQLRLDKATSVSEVISLGKNYLDKNPNLEFIIGNLYNDNNFVEKRILEKSDLDKISKDIPIAIYRVCGHICTVNSKAIELLGLNPRINIEGGSIDIRNGELTGVIRENAMELLNPVFDKQYSIPEYKELILEAVADANKVGLTSLQPNDISRNIEIGLKKYTAYKELVLENKLNARINHQITFDTVDEFVEFLEKVDFENDYLKLGPIKLFIDGSLGANTAAMFDNYLGDNQNGIICLTKDQLRSFVEYGFRNNRPIIIHAIGDRGINSVLNEFEVFNKEKNENRNGIVHVQITSNEILQRFKNLGVCALVQPIFINTDMFMVYDKVKKELADTSYAFRTLLENTMTSFSSDAPVEDFNPFYGIYHAVTRKDITGKHIYIKEEGVSLEDAITSYTTNGAYMSFEENKKGRIEEGYLADLVILEQDIYNIDFDSIKDIEVKCTIVGGRIVYEK